MKKILFILMLCVSMVLTTNTNAQTFSNTDCLTMTYIIEGTNLNIDECRTACVEFFNNSYDNTNITQRETYSLDKLQYKGSLGKLCSFSMGYWELRDKHQINVSIKDNRLKIDIVSFDVELNYTKGYSNSEVILKWKNLYPLNTEMNVLESNVTKKNCQIAYDNWIVMANNLIKTLENYIKSYKVSEDW